MRVAVINPWNRSVTIQDMPKGIHAIYDILSVEGQPKVDDFDIVSLSHNVMAYVDGEGFLKPNQPVWHILGHGNYPLCGKGILFGGTNTSGDDLPLPASIGETRVLDAIRWTEKLSTGNLEPTKVRPGKISIGQPILKDNTDEPA